MSKKLKRKLIRHNKTNGRINDVRFTNDNRKSLSPKQKYANRIALIIGVIASIIAIYQFIKDSIKSQKEKYNDETFVKGTLRPSFLTKEIPYNHNSYTVSESPINFSITNNIKNSPAITGIKLTSPHSKKWVYVQFGAFGFIVKISDLRRGVELFSKNLIDCTSKKIFLGVKDDRLYISTEFKDLQKEETIGVIEFNHWKLYKPNLFDYRNDDKRLEVVDKQNNIVFSINYISKFNGVLISGYFIDERSIVILPTAITETDRSVILNSLKGSDLKNFQTCIYKKEANWKILAQREISLIHSVYDFTPSTVNSTELINVNVVTTVTQDTQVLHRDTTFQ